MNKRVMIGIFSDERALLKAVKEIRNIGCDIADVISPIPIHGLDEELGLNPSRLMWVGFAAGATGLLFALLLQFWTSAVDWPLNVGGKPFNSFPVFIPVAFELTVLFSGLFAVGGFFLKNRKLSRGIGERLKRATDDRFILVINENDASFDPVKTLEILGRNGSVKIKEEEYPL